MASFAEYEKAKIKERTTRGRNEKGRQGKIPGGRIAYGLRVVEGKVGRDLARRRRRVKDRMAARLRGRGGCSGRECSGAVATA